MEDIMGIPGATIAFFILRFVCFMFILVFSDIRVKIIKEG
jgi:hypothetical protein